MFIRVSHLSAGDAMEGKKWTVCVLVVAATCASFPIVSRAVFRFLHVSFGFKKNDTEPCPFAMGVAELLSWGAPPILILLHLHLINVVSLEPEVVGASSIFSRF